MAQRPWLASSELVVIFRAFCARFNTIQFSPLLRGWYEEFQVEEEEDQVVRGQSSLSHAAQRFDYIAKPFAICSLTFTSVVLTAIKARAERKNDPQGKAAYLFGISLRALAVQPAYLVLSGMLADAMREALMLTRSFDHELADTSLLHSQLQRFMKNTQTLFVSEKCVESGFTKHMLEAVKKQWIWVDGAQGTVDWPPRRSSWPCHGRESEGDGSVDRIGCKGDLHGIPII